MRYESASACCMLSEAGVLHATAGQFPFTCLHKNERILGRKTIKKDSKLEGKSGLQRWHRGEKDVRMEKKEIEESDL